jgi:TolB-like protein
LIWAAVRAARPKPLFLAVAVTPCSNLGGLERLEKRAQAFGPAIAQDLREFRALRVSTPEQPPGLNVPFPNYPLIADRLSVDTLVRCSLYPIEEGGYGIIAQLVDGHNSLRLWWDIYPTDGTLDKEVASDIALAVARTARVAYAR